MNPAIAAIFENLADITVAFEPTTDAFKSDKTGTGECRELSVKKLLESFFPNNYSIKKGTIYDNTSNSQSIDCIILHPSHPTLITPKRNVILADGVYAAIEVKPDISTLTESSEFHRGLCQLQSVKKLKRECRIFDRNATPNSLLMIPTALFANHARNAIDMINYIKKCVEQKLFSIEELPDVIVTLIKNSILFHTNHIEKTLFAKLFPQQTGEAFISIETTKKEHTLGVFLLILLRFIPPESHISGFFIDRYIAQGIPDTINVQLLPGCI